jgi:hypothetical protein
LVAKYSGISLLATHATTLYAPASWLKSLCSYQNHMFLDPCEAAPKSREKQPRLAHHKERRVIAREYVPGDL